jgi:hypothetical protein
VSERLYSVSYPGMQRAGADGARAATRAAYERGASGMPFSSVDEGDGDAELEAVPYYTGASQPRGAAAASGGGAAGGSAAAARAAEEVSATGIAPGPGWHGAPGAIPPPNVLLLVPPPRSGE